MTSEDSSRGQKIRAALDNDVESICLELCNSIGLNITKASMDIITELVYKKISLYGSDLEAFARHAKRTSISVDDVKLLVRRNPSLKRHLESLSTTKKQRRKTITKDVGIYRPGEQSYDEGMSRGDDAEIENEHSAPLLKTTTTMKLRRKSTNKKITERPVETNNRDETMSRVDEMEMELFLRLHSEYNMESISHSNNETIRKVNDTDMKSQMEHFESDTTTMKPRRKSTNKEVTERPVETHSRDETMELQKDDIFAHLPSDTTVQMYIKSNEASTERPVETHGVETDFYGGIPDTTIVEVHARNNEETTERAEAQVNMEVDFLQELKNLSRAITGAEMTVTEDIKSLLRDQLVTNDRSDVIDLTSDENEI